MFKDFYFCKYIIIFEKNSFIFFLFCPVFRDVILKVTFRNYRVAVITAITPAVGDISNKAAYFLKDSHIFRKYTALLNPVLSSAIVAVCF
jgi:hypothetical protein